MLEYIAPVSFAGLGWKLRHHWRSVDPEKVRLPGPGNERILTDVVFNSLEKLPAIHTSKVMSAPREGINLKILEFRLLSPSKDWLTISTRRDMRQPMHLQRHAIPF